MGQFPKDTVKGNIFVIVLGREDVVEQLHLCKVLNVHNMYIDYDRI